MRKKILVLVLTVAMVCGMSGCGSMVETAHDYPSCTHSQYINMEYVEEGNSYAIYRDTNTNVLYWCSGGTGAAMISPIYNSDGSLKLYEE